LLSLTDLGITDEIIENGITVEENALIKVNYVFEHYQLNCFADDTGLLVDALNGAPGVHTARYAGSQKSAEDNMNKLLGELAMNENRNAHFKTIIAYRNQLETKIFEGKVNGVISINKLGAGGFGYDPIFIPSGYNKTFAQLPLGIKNQISHRGRAMKKFMDYLNESH
jgi:XTP/dITP diphosphohydrolase